MIEGMIRVALLAAAVARGVGARGAGGTGPGTRPGCPRPGADREARHEGDDVRKLAAERGDDSKVDESLKTCPAVQKDPSQAFGAVLVLLPALLAELVNEYRPQLTEVHDTLTAMRPHSPLFRQWVTAEGQSFGLILQFDNHGKKIDYCDAATVLLDNKSTAADIRNAIGVDPALIGKLFSTDSSTAGKTLQRVNPQMRRFFRAAGVSPAIAAALTT